MATTDSVQNLLRQGLAFHQRSELDRAQACYQEILAADPNHIDAMHLLGVVKGQRGEKDEALRLIERVVQKTPRAPLVLVNHGNALSALGRHEEAIASFDKATALQPTHADGWANKGKALSALGRHADAVASYDKALAINPLLFAVWNSRGSALVALERREEALESFNRALAVKPDHAPALNNRGDALMKLGRPEEALKDFDRALAVEPGNAVRLGNRANALYQLRRFGEALSAYDAAIAARPDFVEGHTNRGVALSGMMRAQEAMESFRRALSIEPGHVEAHCGLGGALMELDRYDEAVASFEQALRLEPDQASALGGLAEAAAQSCDWDRIARLRGRLEEHVRARRPGIAPLSWLGYSGDPESQLLCASNLVAANAPRGVNKLWNGAIYERDKIRLAYLSSDFRNHPVSQLIVGLLELHDRSRFEVHGVSIGADDGGEQRRRVIRAFDVFHDVRNRSDEEIARGVRAREIDIVVDLNGHTQNSRLGICARRPAPVQVSYLGYPGSMGSPAYDYVLADPITLPLDQQPHWTERIVHLPHCFLPADSRRGRPTVAVTRREMGLPDDGFVFCCFNNNWKITPPLFDIWMRLMSEMPGSVLWLSQRNEVAKPNLRREAEARGIGGERIIFAERVDMDRHLARHRLADLFLDTLPYNAHTTASDALWMGLPIVTCPGRSFASRVCASLLHAVGMPELVCRNLEEYEALARRLARDPSLLRSIKAKLEDNLPKAAHFDTDLLRRHVEAAYERMCETYRRGESPSSFAVTP
jgi:predicted O-linked N-acetylglucosamine transferase (SPINDLY family)